ncbi:MAG: hypothetical protein ACLS4Z_05740, partial [Christensenellaceae bacterium]
MSFKGYLSSKAAGLCLCGVGEIVWGIFAFFAGANAVLLWGGEIFFFYILTVRITVPEHTDLHVLRLRQSDLQADRTFIIK